MKPVIYRALLALGSNQGDRARTIRQALAVLDHHPAIRLLKISRLIETEPVGMDEGDAAGMFLNAAAMIETRLSPEGLLSVCLETERRFGRNRDAPGNTQAGYRSRTLDVDILFFEDQLIRREGLEIPHPRLHERAFVLVPLVEIAPDWIHPVFGRRVSELYECLKTSHTVKAEG